jgi:hypothetical protein
MKWTIIGRSSLPEDARINADGLQISSALADRSHRADRAVKRSGRCEIAAGYESNASDGQNRY